MAAKKSTRSPRSDSSFPSEPELIVLARPEAALRSTATDVASAAGAKVSSLNSLLKAAGAQLVPIFGSEERVRQAPSMRMAMEAGALPGLSAYYSVIAAPDKLEAIAADLLNEPTVEAAYVNPPAEPPV